MILEKIKAIVLAPYLKKIGELENQIAFFKEEYQSLKAESTDPMSIVRRTFQMDLPWVNYQDFDKGRWDQYHREAQLILSSFVVENEINFIRVNWAKKAMLEISNDSIADKAKHLEKICWMLIGMETLRDRLADIQAPTVQNVSDLE